MEELQSLLRYYNLSHLDDMEVAPWSKQYCEDEFPRYWQVVYSILEKLDRKLRIIEIGCGLGDVTTIPCYLGFDKVISFEKNPEYAKELFAVLTTFLIVAILSIIKITLGLLSMRVIYF